LVTCPKCGNVLKHFEVLMEGVAKYDFILKYNDNSEVSPKYFPQYTLEEFMPKVGVQIKFGCSKCHWVFNSVDEKKAIEILKIGG
jgi:transcription initiation factor IIE alpha subunit